jgi:hypothetical protein
MILTGRYAVILVYLFSNHAFIVPIRNRIQFDKIIITYVKFYHDLNLKFDPIKFHQRSDPSGLPCCQIQDLVTSL